MTLIFGYQVTKHSGDQGFQALIVIEIKEKWSSINRLMYQELKKITRNQELLGALVLLHNSISFATKKNISELLSKQL